MFDERQTLNGNLRAELASRGTLVGAAPGDVVFVQGDGADSVYFIERGLIKLSTVSDSGKEAVLAILNENNIFGHESLVGQQQRSQTASALTDCEIIRIDNAIVLDMVENHPSFSNFMVSYLLRLDAMMEEELISLRSNSCEKRLAHLLVRLANIDGNSASGASIPRITHETLAGMVGTTRPRISCFMNEFRRAGYIEYGENIYVRPSILKMLRDE